MPQIFQVLRCYACKTYQVQQRKKVNKWVCSMCGEKQSVQHVFTEGTGKQCRSTVQSINLKKGMAEAAQGELAMEALAEMDADSEAVASLQQEGIESLVFNKLLFTEKCSQRPVTSKKTKSKWSVFLETEEEDETDLQTQDENGVTYTTTIISPKCKGKRKVNVGELKSSKKNDDNTNDWFSKRRRLDMRNMASSASE
eukprot:m.89622 g.89622  ORF g.89622 m.89622 type:complete len:198 (-) comp13232_c0_seq4:52-645(-)